MEGVRTKKKFYIVYRIVFVLLPILVGAILYYLFCPNVWFVKILDGWLGQPARPALDVLAHPFLRLMRNYAFDFLWAFAMTNALFIILYNNAKPMICCLVLPVLLGIVMEILQLLGIAQGTFDALDIVVEGGGSLLGAIIINIFRRNSNEKN